MITLENTQRGSLRGTFDDLTGIQCSIQESSLATTSSLWLGRDGTRMHLSREMAADLARHLQRFAETGTLSQGQDGPVPRSAGE